MPWLMLKRKVGQRVRIRTPGGDIWVVLAETVRGGARIGIDALREYEIDREELLTKRPPVKGD